MKSSNLIVLFLIVLITALGLSSCTSDEDTHPIVGEWMLNRYIYDISLSTDDSKANGVLRQALDSTSIPYEQVYFVKFKTDGKLEVNERVTDNTYSINTDDILTFENSVNTVEVCPDLKYMVEGNSLILTYDMTDYFKQEGFSSLGIQSPGQINKVAINVIFVRISNR